MFFFFNERASRGRRGSSRTTTPKQIVNKSRDHFLPVLPHCLGATAGSFFPLSSAQFSERRYPGARHAVLAVTFCHCQQLRFCFHHFIIDTPLIPFLPSLSLSLSFSIPFFTSAVNIRSPLFHPLSFSHAHTHAHAVAFFPFPTVEKRADILGTRGQFDRERNQRGTRERFEALRSGFGERASE